MDPVSCVDTGGVPQWGWFGAGAEATGSIASAPDPNQPQRGSSIMCDTGGVPQWGWFGSGAEATGSIYSLSPSPKPTPAWIASSIMCDTGGVPQWGWFGAGLRLQAPPLHNAWNDGFLLVSGILTSTFLFCLGPTLQEESRWGLRRRRGGNV